MFCQTKNYNLNFILVYELHYSLILHISSDNLYSKLWLFLFIRMTYLTDNSTICAL